MIKTIERKMLEQNAKAVKHLKILGLNNAAGKIKKINQQIDRDFGLAGPFTLSTPSERVHAVRWANAREIFVMSTFVKRLTKEVVAAGVSEINACPYCVDVHGTSIKSTGATHISKNIIAGKWRQIEDNNLKQLYQWSINTRNPTAEIIINPPFNREEAPEIIGTALEFHSTNRLVSIFLDKSPLPSFLSNRFIKKFALNIASKTLFKSMVSKHIPNYGESLQFIEDNGGNNNTNSFYQNIPAFQKTQYLNIHLLDLIEKEYISPSVASLFYANITNWNGEEKPLGLSWLNNLLKDIREKEQPVAKLVFLAAFAPHMISENVVSAFREVYPSDKALLEVCYWSIQKITQRIESWLILPFQQNIK